MTGPLPLPPEDLCIGVGPFADGALFRTSGMATVKDIVTLCGMRPGERVLDIGCGCGRLAAPLAILATPSGHA